MNDKLPMVVKENELIVNKRNNKRFIDNVKKYSGVTIKTAIALAAMIKMSGIVVPAAIFTLAGTSAAKDILVNKKDKSSLFATIKSLNVFDKKLTVGQFGIPFAKANKRINTMDNKYEKASMMGMELMMMMNGYQQEYRDKGIETVPSKDGKSMVYPQVFEATTHGVNIKMIEALEKLGYIEITDKKEAGKSLLLIERLGFGEHKEAWNALKSKVLKKDDSKDYEKQMYSIEMRLTDKDLNLEDLYKTYLEKKNTKGKSDDRKAYKRIGLMIEALREQNIDIKTNELGEQELVKADTSLAKRVEKEVEEEVKSLWKK